MSDPRSELPPGLVAAAGLGRLPGARVAGVGPVHGLAVSVSLDGKSPSRDERKLIAEILGGAASDQGATIARALDAASGGKFRLSFSALPGLVDARGSEQLSDAARIRALASASLRSWTQHLDIGGFDNDGPDGVAGSPDDDGVVDLFVMVVEGEQDVPSVTVPGGASVGTASGRKTVESGPIHLLGLSRTGGGDPLIAGIGLVLDAAGLEGSERFFPSDFPRIISSLARVRLGWVGTRVADGSAAQTTVAAGEAVLIPLRDMPAGNGFWLIENDGRSVFATRAVRTPSNHFSPTTMLVWAAGRPLVLPLTRQLGELGPRAVVGGGDQPVVHFEGMPDRDAPASRPNPAVRW